MTDAIGRADYILGTDVTAIKSGMAAAEAEILKTGAAAEQAFGAKATGAIDKAGVHAGRLAGQMDALKTKAAGFGSSFASIGDSIKRSWSGAEIGKGFVQGLGLAGGLGAARLFSTAIGKVEDVLGDATKAALEEEDSIQALGSALRASIPAWDGNTTAIERVLTARMKLGFSDDEQRNSLARLVTVTHDVDKALDIERLAMDLARFKKVDLATATQSLILVEGGQYRGLKQLIGSTTDITTQTQALAAVQRAASGAAADYAATNSGKLLVSQDNVGESMEKLGKITLPIVVAATQAAADMATDLAGNLDGVTKAAAALSGVFPGVGKGASDATGDTNDFIHAGQDLLATLNPTKVSGTFGVFLDTIDKMGIDTQGARNQLNGLGFDVDSNVKTMAGILDRGADNMSTSLGAIGDAAKAMSDDVAEANRRIRKTTDLTKDRLVSDANDMLDAAFDPLIKHDRLWADIRELSAQRAIVASKDSTKAQKRDAADLVTSLTKTVLGEKVELLKMGALSAKEQAGLVADLDTQIRKSKGTAHAALVALKVDVLAFESLPVIPIKFKVSLTGASALTKLATGLGFVGNQDLYKRRAGGGPIAPGELYRVGEYGPEWFVGDKVGKILPTGQSPAALMSAPRIAPGFIAAAMRPPTNGPADVAAAISAAIAAWQAGSRPTSSITYGPTNIAVQLPTTARPDPFEVAHQLRRIAELRLLTPRSDRRGPF